MPPGRTPIETRWTSDDAARGVWEFLRREIAEGRQAYVVYPVIEESKQELKAATAEYERLAKTVFPEAARGLAARPSEKRRKRSGDGEVSRRRDSDSGRDHGDRSRRGRAQCHRDGDRARRAFRSRAAAPAARADRARQRKIALHPGRAEVDRGRRGERIETMVATSNGFEIAERDLKQRGPGEFFGTRQHGDAAFSFAQPLRDHEILEMARREAFALAEDPRASKRRCGATGVVSPAGRSAINWRRWDK